MRVKLLFSEALRSLGANLSTTIAATMTVLIGMFLLGLVIALGSSAQDFANNQKEKLLVKVYFCTESTCDKAATPAQINAVRRQLDGDELVDTATSSRRPKRSTACGSSGRRSSRTSPRTRSPTRSRSRLSTARM